MFALFYCAEYGVPISCGNMAIPIDHKITVLQIWPQISENDFENVSI